MRKLNKAQKKLLDQHSGDFTVESLSDEEQEKLVALNDYESVWTDADRYLGDKYVELKYAKKGIIQ